MSEKTTPPKEQYAVTGRESVTLRIESPSGSREVSLIRPQSQPNRLELALSQGVLKVRPSGCREGQDSIHLRIGSRGYVEVGLYTGPKERAWLTIHELCQVLLSVERDDHSYNGYESEGDDDSYSNEGALQFEEQELDADLVAGGVDALREQLRIAGYPESVIAEALAARQAELEEEEFEDVPPPPDELMSDQDRKTARGGVLRIPVSQGKRIPRRRPSRLR